MWKLFNFVIIVGVFLQAINGEDWDIEKMEQCPCENEIIEGFLDSVSRNTVDIGNGQQLRLRLWQLEDNDCTAHVLGEPSKPGRIEISMVYYGSLLIEEQGEDEGNQEEPTGQQQDAKDINSMQDSIDLEQLQNIMDIGQDQAGVDTAQEQSELSNNSQNGGDKKDHSAKFSFMIDVNTGNLSESTDSETGIKRRKRDIRPFDTVIIKMVINFEKKPERIEEIKAMIKEELGNYWLAFAFCLLDVEQ